MKELITQSQAETALRGIAIAAPILGVVVGSVIGLARKQVRRNTILGLLAGFSGTLIFGLWHLHLTMGRKLGFTSVRTLAIEMVLFLALGLIIGIVYQKMISKPTQCDGTYERLNLTQEENLNAN